MEYDFLRQPERNERGQPIVARHGVPVNTEDLVYFMLTASGLSDEAKSRPGNPEYQIDLPDPRNVSPKYRATEPGQQTMVICGLWSLYPKNNLGEFIDRFVVVRNDLCR